MTISVVALEPGFYTIYRAKGDRFDIQSLADLGNWMSISDGGSGAVVYGASVIPNEGTMPLVQVGYAKRHIGGGNFIVVDFLGAQIGPQIDRVSSDPAAANQTAQGYVDQLNA